MGEPVGLVATLAVTGAAYSMVLFLLAAGLSLTYGMMNVLNLAHGSFFLLGAYLCLTLSKRGVNFWLAALVSALLVAGVGLATEVACLRRMYRRGPLDQVLLTAGIAFMAIDVFRWRFGKDVHTVPTPFPFDGAVQILGFHFPSYRLFLIGVGVAVAVLLWWSVERSRLGAAIRAGVSDPEMAMGIGVELPRLFLVVFGAGAGLAGLSGALASPLLGVGPGMDFATLILALIVVVIGGLGNLTGAFRSSVLVGMIETFGKAWFPDSALFLIYAIMAVVLFTRPQGLLHKGVH